MPGSRALQLVCSDERRPFHTGGSRPSEHEGMHVLVPETEFGQEGGDSYAGTAARQVDVCALPPQCRPACARTTVAMLPRAPRWAMVNCGGPW